MHSKSRSIAIVTVAVTALMSACGGGSDDGGSNQPPTYEVKVDSPLTATETAIVTEGNTWGVNALPQGETHEALYELESVTGCGGLTHTGDGNYQTGEITSDCTITITYRQKFPPVHIVKAESMGYGGNITPRAQSVIDGKTTAFKFSKLDGYELSVSGCGAEIKENVVTTGPIDTACNLIVEFEPHSPESVTVSTTTTLGGYLDPSSARVNRGDAVMFDVITSIGYNAVIEGCGGTIEGKHYITEPIENDCTVSATFTKENANDYVVDWVTDGPAKITIDAETPPPAPIEESQTHTASAGVLAFPGEGIFGFTVDPFAGYEVFDVQGCSMYNGSPNSRTWSNAEAITSDCSVSISLDPRENASLATILTPIEKVGEGRIDLTEGVYPRHFGSGFVIEVSDNEGEVQMVPIDDYEVCQVERKGGYFFVPPANTEAREYCEYRILFE